MFKTNGFEEELYESMRKNLVKQASEERHGFNKIAKAVSYLNSAAELFEKAGMSSESDELTQMIQSFAQAIMPEYTTLPDNWKKGPDELPEEKPRAREMWNGQPVGMDDNGNKYIIVPGVLSKKLLPDNLQPNHKSKNRFNLTPEKVERVQLALNKVIDGFDGTKPQRLVPDQKWGPQTNGAFDWYDKNTNNSPMQSLQALLNSTSAAETIGGMV